MVKVKICGNTNLDDARLAHACGADYIGFIFAKSKRRITPQHASGIIKEMPTYKNFVAVFANQRKEEVEEIANLCKIKWLQFHGEETSRYCHYFMEKGYQVLKTFHIKDALSLKRLDEYNVHAFLFDTYSTKERGGTGETFDWSILEGKPYVQDRLFLAGGLSTHNVKKAVQLVKPYAIDVASGVERSPGSKDPSLLEEFIRQAKGDEFIPIKKSNA